MSIFKVSALLVWIVYGLGVLVYAELTTEYDRILIFKEPVANRALEGHVIRTELVFDDGSCRVKCYLEPNCVSINVGPFDEVTQICELNDETDESEFHLALAERQGFAYHGVENPCQSNPCPSRFTCQVGFTFKGYRCNCPQGGFGLQCESSSLSLPWSSSSSSSSIAATPTPTPTPTPDLSWPAITSTPALLPISATPSAPPSPSSTTTTDHFIPGTGSLVGSFYKLSTEHETWNNAEAKCQSHGAELVKIESAEENEFLTVTFMTASTVTYWIGLTDQAEEGEWMWTDGSPLADYINWGNENPNDLSGNQNCGQIVKGSFQMGGFNFYGYNDGEWNDFRCDYLLGYICEKLI